MAPDPVWKMWIRAEELGEWFEHEVTETESLKHDPGPCESAHELNDQHQSQEQSPMYPLSYITGGSEMHLHSRFGH